MHASVADLVTMDLTALTEPLGVCLKAVGYR